MAFDRSTALSIFLDLSPPAASVRRALLAGWKKKGCYSLLPLSRSEHDSLFSQSCSETAIKVRQSEHKYGSNGIICHRLS
ncbi:hypothetical protein CEXT_505471 [Caerostris extrusa]|uniref:Uncharacterized protein n=1 Tax=Caerostris extrusa TaxID=172846 RepID=A0AAV4V1M8_CAEEX|nr:hypothetical protein CEXT_505471 [Caerostris extrusa]